MTETAAAAPSTSDAGSAPAPTAAPQASEAPLEGAARHARPGVKGPTIPASAPSPSTSAAPAAARPDWLPEKFWSEQGPKVEDLARSFSELEGKLRTRNDDLLKQYLATRAADRPTEAKGYQPTFPSDFKLPDGVEFALSHDDPVVATLAAVAHEQGLGQGEFSKTLAKYAESLLASVPDPTKERAKLGEKAQDRINAVKAWATAHVGEDGFRMLLGPQPTAAHIEVFEKLMSQSREPTLSRGPTPTAQPNPVKSRAELLQMQQDPRYWHPVKADNAYREQVAREWARSFPGTTQIAS